MAKAVSISASRPHRIRSQRSLVSRLRAQQRFSRRLLARRAQRQ